MSDFFVDQIFDGSIIFASLIALIAGLISFASPCVLPLVPGYLAYVGGLAGVRRKTLLGALLFIFGFSALFVTYGALFGELGSRINSNSTTLTRFLGLLTIAFGAIFLFPERFYRTFKFPYVARIGLFGAPLLGFMFGLGWTPCIGPTLGAVQTLALIEASAQRGAILSFAYCVGLGGPFLLFALLLDRSKGLQSFLSRKYRSISLVGGCLLIAIGVLQLTGIWEELMATMRATISGFIPVI